MTAGGGVLAVIVAFFVASSAHDYGGTPIHLSFPLRDGPYVIVQGGTGFFFTPTIQGNAQLDAIDVVKMSDLGFRSSSLWPTDTDVHYVWSDLVKAPCDGNVLASEDDHPDLPPSMADSTAPLGNFVAIGCPEATIVLAFLQKGSLKTPQNVSVHVGDTIAKVGASGLAGEPRLRIYAVRGQERTTARLIGQAEAVPMFFGDVPLVRGDRIAQ